MINFIRFEQVDFWLVFIERGGCIFIYKINVAVEKGVNGVIIYNYLGTGNKVFFMFYQGTENIVVVMIGNLKGMEFLYLIQKGVYVIIIIEVGRMYILWINYYVMFLFIFLVVIVVYFFLYCVWRVRVFNFFSSRRRQIKVDVKKVIG